MVYRRENMDNIGKAELKNGHIDFIKDRTALYFKPIFELKYLIQDLVKKIINKNYY